MSKKEKNDNPSKIWENAKPILLVLTCVCSIIFLIVGTGATMKWLFSSRDKVVIVEKGDHKYETMRNFQEQEEFSRTDVITVVLSSVSVILTAIAISLAMLGVFGYKAMKEGAEIVARRRTEELIPGEVETFLKTRPYERCNVKCSDSADDLAEKS